MATFNFKTFMSYFITVIALANSVTAAIGSESEQDIDMSEDTLTSGGNSMTTQQIVLHGKPGQGYYAKMLIGTPPQKLNVLIDTGSSNFAVAARAHPDITAFFRPSMSATFVDSDTNVELPYTKGNWKGALGSDVVSFASRPDLTVTTKIACITSSEKFFVENAHWQGILGLAYTAIARPDGSTETFFTSTRRQWPATRDVVSIQLCGTIDTGNQTDIGTGGTMTLGGSNESLYVGPMLYTPITKEGYYEVIITDVRVNGSSVDLDCKEYNFDKTIVDSGTTNLRFPNKVYDRVVDRIKRHAVSYNLVAMDDFWSGGKMFCWPIGEMPWNAFPPLTLDLAVSRNSSFRLVVSPRQYLREVSKESTQESLDCFKFAIAPSVSGTVLGAVVMEGYYVVFDRENQKIGFATTRCPHHNTSDTTSHVTGPFPVAFNAFECGYKKVSVNHSTVTIIAYAMAAVCGLCVLVVVALLGHRRLGYWRQSRHQDNESSSLTDNLDEQDK